MYKLTWLVEKNMIQTQISLTVIYTNVLTELGLELQTQVGVNSKLMHHLMAWWPQASCLTSQRQLSLFITTLLKGLIETKKKKWRIYYILYLT